MKTIKRFLGKALMVFVSTAVGLLIAEMALKNFRPSYTVGIPWSFQYDAARGYTLGPGAHVFRLTDFQQESRVNGLGTSNFQDSFAGYEKLVFAVGDSFTQGIGVPADMSYPFSLDLTLNRDDRGLYVKRYGIVNLGVGGYGGEQNLLALRAAVEKFGRPAIILYMGCNNDFVDDLMFRAGYRHGGPISGGPNPGRMGRVLRWVKNETQIGARVSIGVDGRRQERLRRDAIMKMGLGEKAPSSAELEADRLDQLAALAREYGAFLIVTWSGEGESYEWLRSWSAQKGLAFADWAATTNSVQAAMPALPLDNAHSGAHHRGWTNRLIAEEFARVIRANQK